MNGEEQRDRVIRYIFCSIIRNVTDLYPIFPAARDVDDIETDAHPRNHFTVPEPCCDRFADRNVVGQNSDRISNLVYNLALHPDRHQLEPGSRQELLFDRQIGMRWIEIIDSLVFHNSRYSTFSAKRIVLAVRIKYVQHLGLFQGESLMLDSSRQDKTVTCARIERRFTGGELNVTSDDVHQLFMRMAVPHSNPSSFHKVSYQHELLVVCQYLS